MSNYNNDLLIGLENRITQLEEDSAHAQREANKLARENDLLRQALQFYADPRNWDEVETGIGMTPSDAEMDMGCVAREALNKEKG